MPIGYHDLGKSSDPKEWIISHSALNVLEEHPKKFYNYMTGQIEALESPSLERGDLLHLWIEKKDNFVVSEQDKPSPSISNLIETFYNFYVLEKWKENSVFLQYIGQDYNIGMTELFKYHEIFTRLYQRKATDDEIKFLVYALRFSREEAEFNKNLKELTFLDKFVDDLSYLEFLKAATGKIILDKPTKDALFNSYNAILEHPFAKKLLFETEGLNEQEYFWTEKVNDITIQRKCKIDKIIVDKVNKELVIIDLKTTNKPIHLFTDTYGAYHKYKYGRQLWSYANGYFKANDIIELGYGWKIQLFNVVVQSNEQYPVKVFKTMTDYQVQMKQLLNSLSNHIKHNHWNSSMDEYFNGYVNIYDKG